MKLEITHNGKLGEVQSVFNNAFPYLRIEFLQNKQQQPRGQNGSNNKFFDAGLLFGDINQNMKDYSIELQDSTTISELESIFTNKIGLPALIFRKSGNIWMETTITANWTLVQQNQHAKEISAGMLI